MESQEYYCDTHGCLRGKSQKTITRHYQQKQLQVKWKSIRKFYAAIMTRLTDMNVYVPDDHVYVQDDHEYVPFVVVTILFSFLFHD
jgi:hypothetical protein